jgi:hypothetical protein
MHRRIAAWGKLQFAQFHEFDKLDLISKPPKHQGFRIAAALTA